MLFGKKYQNVKVIYLIVDYPGNKFHEAYHVLEKIFTKQTQYRVMKPFRDTIVSGKNNKYPK